LRGVGDTVGGVYDLPLEGHAQFGIEVAHGRRVVVGIVLGDGLAHVPRQVQTAERAVAAFQDIHHPQAVQVVLEPAVIGHQCPQCVLARMSERRVSHVVRQGDGFGQILVQVQPSRRGAADLRHFHGVRQARAEMVALVVDEDLRLVLQATEGAGMDDAFPVALIRRARGVFRLVVRAPARVGAFRRVGGQVSSFARLDVLTRQHGSIPR